MTWPRALWDNGSYCGRLDYSNSRIGVAPIRSQELLLKSPFSGQGLCMALYATDRATGQPSGPVYVQVNSAVSHCSREAYLYTWVLVLIYGAMIEFGTGIGQSRHHAHLRHIPDVYTFPTERSSRRQPILGDGHLFLCAWLASRKIRSWSS